MYLNCNTAIYDALKDVKEVVREVPVDKVVFKEVVKEVIQKELVHVPFYTTDKNLLGLKNDA